MPPGQAVHDIQGRPIILHKEINRDEQYVYSTVERRPEVIAKISLDPLEPRQAERLKALVAARSGTLEDISTWPMTTLHEPAGRPLGFMMLRVDRQEQREVRELYHPTRITPRSWPERLQVAARIAQAFHRLHGAGQVMGNVNGRNILVSPRGDVRLVNVDTYQARTATHVIPSVPGLPEFTPPELQGKGHLLERTANHDLFGLAVILFRLVMDGQHPYAGVPVGRAMPTPGEAIAADLFAYSAAPHPGVQSPPGTPSLSTLSPTVQALFERAFSAAHAQRPGGSEWHTALTDMTASLHPCHANASHLRVPGQPCQQCQQEQAGRDRGVPASVLNEQKNALNHLWQKVQAVRTPEKPTSTSAPELPRTAELPPLPLNLPAAPRSLLGGPGLEHALRWLVRLAVLAAMFSVVYAVQKSFLSAFVIVTLVVMALTLGRRFSVDWDGMIINFQNWEGRLVERLLPTNKQAQAYYAAIEARRAEHRAAFKELRDQYAALEHEYRDRSAFARYQLALSSLDQRRRRLLQQEQQGDAMQNLVQEYRVEALNDYLKRQPLQSGIVPELTSRLALHLSTMGVKRASDVQGEKLKVVRPELATELLAWRDDLTHFFQFNENSIPQARLAEAQQKQQMGQRSEFRQFEHDARKFMNTDWQAEEQEFLEQLQTLKAQAKQRQKALKALDDLAAR